MALIEKSKKKDRRGGSTLKMLFLMASLILPVMSGFAGAAIISSKRLLFGGGAECALVRVIAGDTLRIHCHESGFERVKLVGIDAPRIMAPACFAEYFGGFKSLWGLQLETWKAQEILIKFEKDQPRDQRQIRLYLDGSEVVKTMIFQRLGRVDWRGRAINWCA